MDELKKLRELAEKATPGPWTADGPDAGYHKHHWSVRCPSISRNSLSYELCRISSINCNEQEDAAYIAALSPAVILSLLERLEAAEKVMAEQTDALAMFMSATVGCLKELDPRGYYWVDSYLDEARKHVLGVAVAQLDKQEKQ